jgi:hypothetical protein
MAIDVSTENITSSGEPIENVLPADAPLTEEPITPTPTPLFNLSEEDINVYYNEYGTDYTDEYGEKVSGNLDKVASAMASEISRVLLDRDLAKGQSKSYQSPDGTPDYDRFYRDMKRIPGVGGESVGDYGILDQFTNLKNLQEAGSSKANALLRGITQGGSGVAVGLTGAATTGKVLSYTPLPATKVAGKVVQGLSFLGSTFIGELYAGPFLREQIFGETIDTRTLIPEDRVTFEKYYGAGAITPYVAGGPLMLPSKKLGTYSTLRAIADNLPATYQALALSPGGKPAFNAYLKSLGIDPGNPFTKKYIEQIVSNPKYRESLTSRVVNGLEDALVKGKMSYTMGTPGAISLYSAETATVPVTGALIGQAVRIEPDELLPYTGAAIGGAILPHLSAITVFSKLLPTLREFSQDLRVKDLTPSKDLFSPGKTARQERLAVQALLEAFNKMDEDPLAAADEIERIFINKETGKIKDEYRRLFETKDGEIGPILTSSSLSGNNTALLALENFIFKSGAEANIRGKAFKNAIAMQFGVLTSIRRAAQENAVLDEAGNLLPGDVNKNTRAMLQAANELEQSLYASSFAEYRRLRVENLTLAIKNAYKNDVETGNKVLSEKLLDLIKEENRMFSIIQKSAWSRVKPEGDGIITRYNRYTTDKNGETVVAETSNLPNHISALIDVIDGNSTMKALSPLQIDGLNKSSAAFRTLAAEAVDIIRQNGQVPSKKLLRAARKSNETGDEVLDAPKSTSEDAPQSPPPVDADGQTILDFEGVAQEGVTVQRNVEDLIGDRSAVMAQLRQAQTENDQASRVLSILDRAYLDDIESYTKGYNQAYRHASNLTKGYYAGIRRTFAGDVVRTNKSGRQIVDPSLIISKLTVGSDDVIDAKYVQLGEGSQQLKKAYESELKMKGGEITYTNPITREEVVLTADDVENIGVDMNTTLKFVLLDMLSKTQRSMDAKLDKIPQAATASEKTASATERQATNKSRIEALRKYQANHPRLMAMFPEISRTIDELEPSYEAVDVFNRKLGELEAKRTGNKIVQLLTPDVENPVVALNAALAADNPIKELDRLFELIKFYKPRTKEGIEVAGKPTSQLRWENALEKRGLEIPERLKNGTRADLESGILSLVLEAAFTKAGAKEIALDTETFNPAIFVDFLFGRIAKSGGEDESLIKYLTDKKLINKQMASRLKIASERLVAGIIGGQGTDSFDPIAQEGSILANAMIRATGARIASNVSGMLPLGPVGDSGLVISGLGAKLADQIMNMVPYLQRARALEVILTDPVLLVKSLRTEYSPKEAESLLKTFRKRFEEAGVAVIYNTAARSGARTLPKAVAIAGQDEDYEVALTDSAYKRQIAETKRKLDPILRAVEERPEILPTYAPRIKILEGQIEQLEKERTERSYQYRDKQRQSMQPAPRPEPRPLQTSMAPPAPPTGQTSPQTTARLSAAFPEDDILALANPTNKGIASLMG